MEIKKLILIHGYMHSGTTLVHDIITKHPGVLKSRKESKIIEFDDYLGNKYKKADDKLKFLNELSEINCDSSLIKAYKYTRNVIVDYFGYLNYVADVLNKTHIIEATPNNYLHFSKLSFVKSDVFNILITRDPRDILSSIKKRNEIVKRENYKNINIYFKRKIAFNYSLFLNAYSVKKSFSKLSEFNEIHSKNSVIFDYSEMIFNYEYFSNKICELTGLNIESFPAVEDLHVLNSAHNDLKGTKGLVYISKYKQTLTKFEIMFIEFIFRDYYKKYPNLEINTVTPLSYFVYFIYLLKSPFDLMVFLIKRSLRFRSFSKFFSYLLTVFKRFK